MKNVFQPINMIHNQNKDQLQQTLSKYSHNFEGLGKLKVYQIKLYIDTSIKSVVEPQITLPYNLQQQVNKFIEGMIKNDFTEENPMSEPSPLISNVVVLPNPGGSLRMTLDERNINKIINSSNLPLPRQEDIKAKLKNSQIFSKMEFKLAFSQLELHPKITVPNHVLCKYQALSV